MITIKGYDVIGLKIKGGKISKTLLSQATYLGKRNFRFDVNCCCEKDDNDRGDTDDGP